MSDIGTAALLELVIAALAGQGFGATDAAVVAEEFVVAEYLGRRTHGVGKVTAMNVGDLSAVPTERRTGCVVSVDGNGGNGFLLFRRLAVLAAGMAAGNGVAVVTARNFSRYSALYPYTEIVARAGCIGILLNSAGPAAVAPHGAVDPVTGTNPLAFSFPLGDDVQTFDFSTSERVWGAIRQAVLDEQPLPAGTFLDTDGIPTTDPGVVNAVRAFGGAKGWALNLAVELLSAAAGGRVGEAVDSEFDLAAVLVALDPQVMGAGDGFAEAAQGLFTQIRAARPEGGGDGVHVPGDLRRTHGGIADILADPAPLAVPDVTLERLRRMARGERVDDLASDPLFN